MKTADELGFPRPHDGYGPKVGTISLIARVRARRLGPRSCSGRRSGLAAEAPGYRAGVFPFEERGVLGHCRRHEDGHDVDELIEFSLHSIDERGRLKRGGAEIEYAVVAPDVGSIEHRAPDLEEESLELVGASGHRRER